MTSTIGPKALGDPAPFSGLTPGGASPDARSGLRRVPRLTHFRSDVRSGRLLEVDPDEPPKQLGLLPLAPIALTRLLLPGHARAWYRYAAVRVRPACASHDVVASDRRGGVVRVRGGSAHHGVVGVRRVLRRADTRTGQPSHPVLSHVDR